MTYWGAFRTRETAEAEASRLAFVNADGAYVVRHEDHERSFHVHGPVASDGQRDEVQGIARVWEANHGSGWLVKDWHMFIERVERLDWSALAERLA